MSEATIRHTQLDVILSSIGDAPVAAAIAALAERQRQIQVEGWTAEHDDEHDDGQLAKAAAAYALAELVERSPMPEFWPWQHEWWKPKGRWRNLVRAIALLLAELEREQRIDDGYHEAMGDAAPAPRMNVCLPGLIANTAATLDAAGDSGRAFAIRELGEHLEQVRAEPVRLGEFFALYVNRAAVPERD